MSNLKDALKIMGVIVSSAAGTIGIGHLVNQCIYDKDGYNRYGYNKDGFDRDGYNKNGFDKNNFDREGYDLEGFSKKGYNREGYDKKGFDKNGFNRQGYNKKGYNKDGLDRSKNDKTYYKQRIMDMKKLIDKANMQINKESYDYALQDLRKSLEIGIKCLISHNLGQISMKKNLSDNIKICEIRRLCDGVFINELIDATKHCNNEMHDNEYHKSIKETKFVLAIALKLKEHVYNNCLN